MITITGHSRKNPHIIKWDCFTFPGGEIQVKLDVETKYPVFKKIIVEAELSNPTDIITLSLLSDALIRDEMCGVAELVLKLGYLPYARQDRVCNKGEANSSVVMSELINTMGFEEVVVLDPHSENAIEFLDGVTVRTQSDVLTQTPELVELIKIGAVTMVAPDEGARAKVEALADEFGVDFIQAHKVRDPKTGALSGFSYEGDVTDESLIIMDDICDGGGTFIGLTKELLAGGAREVDLFVSHGIFSKGLSPLFRGGISHIYTTNSVPTEYVNTNRFTRLTWS